MDRGLQPERTALAWTRTAAGFLLNTLLVLRAAWMSRSLALILLSGCLAGVAAAIFIYRRTKHADGDRAASIVMAGVSAGVLSACMLAAFALVRSA